MLLQKFNLNRRFGLLKPHLHESTFIAISLICIGPILANGLFLNLRPFLAIALVRRRNNSLRAGYLFHIRMLYHAEFRFIHFIRISLGLLHVRVFLRQGLIYTRYRPRRNLTVYFLIYLFLWFFFLSLGFEA